MYLHPASQENHPTNSGNQENFLTPLFLMAASRREAAATESNRTCKGCTKTDYGSEERKQMYMASGSKHDKQPLYNNFTLLTKAD